MLQLGPWYVPKMSKQGVKSGCDFFTISGTDHSATSSMNHSWHGTYAVLVNSSTAAGVHSNFMVLFIQTDLSGHRWPFLCWVPIRLDIPWQRVTRRRELVHQAYQGHWQALQCISNVAGLLSDTPSLQACVCLRK